MNALNEIFCVENKMKIICISKNTHQKQTEQAKNIQMKSYVWVETEEMNDLICTRNI